MSSQPPTDPLDRFYKDPRHASPLAKRHGAGKKSNARMAIFIGLGALGLVVVSVTTTVLLLTSLFDTGLVANQASSPLVLDNARYEANRQNADPEAASKPPASAEPRSDTTDAFASGQAPATKNRDRNRDEGTTPENSQEQPREKDFALPEQFSQWRKVPGDKESEVPSPPVEQDKKAKPLGSPLGHDFAYRFEGGEEFFYDYEIEVSKDAKLHRTIKGVVALKPEKQKEVELQPRSTGTAFAVSKNHIISCAHVIQNSRHYTVSIEGVEFPATVVSIDVDKDLALLQVDGVTLVPLPLADSDDLGLAEEVYAFGYPLSDLLGEHIKVARGIVAGISSKAGNAQITIDGAVNPGNSGGPVLNSRGQVIGVATAKVSGQTISPVAFASPVLGVREILSVEGLDDDSAPQAEEMSSKSIAAQTVPSVFLIKSFPWRDNVVRDVRFAITGTDSKRTSRRYVNGKVYEGRRSDGRIQLSRLGDIVDTQDQEPLPYSLGRLTSHLLLPLSEGSKAEKWQTYNQLRIEKTPQLLSPFDLLARQRRRAGFGPPEDAEADFLLAHEMTKFQVSERQTGSVKVKKSYRFSTEADKAEDKRQLSGEGVWAFDLDFGVPIGTELKLAFSEQDERYDIVLRIAPGDKPDDFEWGKAIFMRHGDQIENMLKNQLESLRGF